MLWPLGAYLDDAARSTAQKYRSAIARGEIPERPDGSRKKRLAGSPGTVAAFSVIWLRDWVAPERHGRIRRNGTANGLALAEQRLTDYILPAEIEGIPFGSLQLRAVRVKHLRGLKAWLVGLRKPSGSRKLSDQTVRHILSDVRCMLLYAEEIEAVDTAPSFRRLLPRVQQVEPRHVPDVGIEKILAVASQAEADAIRLAILTGMRWSEQRRLQWHEVDLDSDPPKIVIAQTKSGRLRRVRLTAEAVELLAGMRSRSMSVSVSPLRARTAGGYVARLRERAGFHWTWHQLRHTYAYRWLRPGGSIAGLAASLGHSTTRTTEIYGRLIDELAHREGARIEPEQIRIARRVADKWQDADRVEGELDA